MRVPLTVHDIIEQQHLESLGIDPRRLTSFGILKGFLRRIRRWPYIKESVSWRSKYETLSESHSSHHDPGMHVTPTNLTSTNLLRQGARFANLNMDSPLLSDLTATPDLAAQINGGSHQHPFSSSAQNTQNLQRFTSLSTNPITDVKRSRTTIKPSGSSPNSLNPAEDGKVLRATKTINGKVYQILSDEILVALCDGSRCMDELQLQFSISYDGLMSVFQRLEESQRYTIDIILH